MRVDFKPQRLLRNLVLEEKIPNGIRRIIQTQGKNSRTIDMELSNLDSLGNPYPGDYYVSSYKVYDTKSSRLLKMMDRQVIGTANSQTALITKNASGKYDNFIITRNNDKITKK